MFRIHLMGCTDPQILPVGFAIIGHAKRGLGRHFVVGLTPADTLRESNSPDDDCGPFPVGTKDDVYTLTYPTLEVMMDRVWIFYSTRESALEVRDP
jgi:hypothetical protein